MKDEKSNLVEVEKDVIEGRFKIIDELREENKLLKENNPIINNLEAKNIALEREYGNKKKELKELKEKNSVLSFADYIHYTVKTNSDIKLGISIRKEDQDIFRNEGREGTIYRLGTDPQYDKQIFKTCRTDDIKTCIEEANDYIKNTFKTDLD